MAGPGIVAPQDKGGEYTTSPAQTGTPAEFSREAWLIPTQLHELTGDVGGLKVAVQNLRDSTERQNNSLDEIKRVVSFTKGAVVTIGILFLPLVTFIAWLVNIIIDLK